MVGQPPKCFRDFASLGLSATDIISSAHGVNVYGKQNCHLIVFSDIQNNYFGYQQNNF